jgi:hypothetical protein
MDSKVCTKCGKEKSIDTFPWKSELLNRRHAVCKTCNSTQSRNWYANNKASHKANVNNNKVQTRERAIQYVWDYLSTHPCVNFGEINPVGLEFDHIKGKRSNVLQLITNDVSLERTQKEIIRCQVFCANCHRIKTAEERGWFKLQSNL